MSRWRHVHLTVTAEAAVALTTLRLTDVLAQWRPGSHDTADTPSGANRAWTWIDEAHDLATRTPGYQAGIVDRVRREGVGFLDDAGGPILLGNDGRVWDGHHRLCAALTLGIQFIQADVVPGGPSAERKHREALADTGDAYTQFHGWVLQCLWCDFEAVGKSKAEARRSMQRHYNDLLPEGCEIR